MSEAENETVIGGRNEVSAILKQTDARLLVVAGPCSIHDTKGALEYAHRLAGLRRELAGQLCIIYDPHLDGSDDIQTGLKKARALLLEITSMGLPTATEFLDPVVPQYIADLVSWAAIGARTTESQTHRQMASGLSMPVGFKNGTDGSLQIAIDAMKSAMSPHSFLGIDQDGATSIVRTTGNPDGHVVLRGGRTRSNYDAASIGESSEALTKSGLPPVLMVDCSHANSGKQHARQEEVWKNLVEQRLAGSPSLIGVMIESNLAEGSQPIPPKLEELRYGVSVTDACLGWDVTERMLREGCGALAEAGRSKRR